MRKRRGPKVMTTNMEATKKNCNDEGGADQRWRRKRMKRGKIVKKGGERTNDNNKMNVIIITITVE